MGAGGIYEPTATVVTPDAPTGHVNVQFRLLSSEPLPEQGVGGWTEVGYNRLDRGSGGGEPRIRFSLEYYLEPDAGLTDGQREFVTDAGTLRVYSKVDVVTDSDYPTPPTERWGLLDGCGGKTLCTTTLRYVWEVEDFGGRARYDLVPMAGAACSVPESYAEKATFQALIMDDDGGYPNVPGR